MQIWFFSLILNNLWSFFWEIAVSRTSRVLYCSFCFFNKKYIPKTSGYKFINPLQPTSRAPGRAWSPFDTDCTTLQQSICSVTRDRIRIQDKSTFSRSEISMWLCLQKSLVLHWTRFTFLSFRKPHNLSHFASFLCPFCSTQRFYWPARFVPSKRWKHHWRSRHIWPKSRPKYSFSRATTSTQSRG